VAELRGQLEGLAREKAVKKMKKQMRLSGLI